MIIREVRDLRKKLTVHTLALGNLKNRKKQYASLIIGIILAMVFSSGVLLMFSSFTATKESMRAELVGYADGIYSFADPALFEKAKEQNVVGDYGFAHVVGGVYTDADSEPYAAAYYDDEAAGLANIRFIEGHYPQNENEIAIEKTTLDKLGIDAETGDTITLGFLVQNGESYLDGSYQKEYVLSGIAENKLINITSGYNISPTRIPSVFVADSASLEPGGKEMLVCYFKYADTGLFSGSSGYDRFYTFMEENYSGENLYQHFFDPYIGVSYQNDMFSESVGFVVFLIVILMLASCIGIVNAFNSNLRERRKQIGMLRTVGATKRQIVIIFGREALILSLICVPLSIATACLLVKGITLVLGDGFVFAAKAWILVLCAVFGMICVMLAALIPLIGATKISPVQTVRNINITRKAARRKIKSRKSFLPAKLIAQRSLFFHGKSRIAVSIILVVTIVFSCFGFSLLEFEKNQSYTREYDYSLNISGKTVASPLFNIEEYENGYTVSDYSSVLSLPYVKSVNRSLSCKAAILADELTEYQKAILYANASVFDSFYEYAGEITAENIDDFYKNHDSGALSQIKSACGYGEELIPITIVAFDEPVIEKLEPYISRGDMNMSALESGSEVILYAPKNVALYYEEDTGNGFSYGIDIGDDINTNKSYLKTGENNYETGDEIEISVLTGTNRSDSISDSLETGDDIPTVPKKWERNDKTVRIGAIAYELPDSITFYENTFGFTYSGITLVTTVNAMKSFYGIQRYSDLNITLDEECTDEMDREMTDSLQGVANTVENGRIESAFSYLKEQEQFRNSMLISLASILILFLSISASIINNSLTAQIREGRREIGTLRAVGASARELFGSYIRQLLSLLGISYAVGFAVFAVGYAGTFIFSAVTDSGPPSFQLSLWQTVLACVLLFLFCGVNLWLKIKKEMKHSVIDNIREL